MGFGARLAMVFACVTAATAVLVGGASYVTADVQVLNEIDDFLEERAEEIVEGERLDRGSGRGQNRGDDAAVLQAPDVFSPDAEVQFLSEDGAVLSGAASGVVLPVDDVDIELADDGGNSVMRTVSIDDTDYRMITRHIPGGGAVQVARSLDESVNLLDVLQARLIIVALSMAAIAGAVGWVLAQRTTRPLRALSRAVDQVAETRDFSVPVPVRASDEVGRLARGFNRMLEALQLSQMQQRRLVQDAAHELRTPLTSITANIDWLMRAPDLDPEARGETLGGIRRELRELNGLISEIIELATDSHQTAPHHPVDLVEIATAAVEQFESRTGREVTVNAAPSIVSGDAAALGRALTNLLSNADKYSPPDTPVIVEVQDGLVAVGDAGPGVPEAERELIFSRFYRRDNDRSKPGSGLGLSIVASIVEQHGGRVVVGTSDLGGARIGFQLPVS